MATASRKHLVLDHDVHLRLMRRKRETGLAASQIGNAILRVCLDGSVPQFELLRDTLVSAGKLTEADFDEAIAETIDALRAKTENWTDCLPESQSEPSNPGSWEIREIGEQEDGALRLLEFRARDRRERPTPAHHNAADVHVLIVSGHVLFAVNSRHSLHTAPSTLHIPAGSIHLSVPLTEDARYLAVSVPK